MLSSRAPTLQSTYTTAYVDVMRAAVTRDAANDSSRCRFELADLFLRVAFCCKEFHWGGVDEYVLTQGRPLFDRELSYGAHLLLACKLLSLKPWFVLAPTTPSVNRVNSPHEGFTLQAEVR
jgi:hypothetical protein